MGLIDLSVALTKKKRNRIKAIGIELEGGWFEGFKNANGLVRDSSVKFPALELNPGHEHYHAWAGYPTSSVQLNAFYRWKAKNYPAAQGELPSRPMSLDDGGKFWKEWLTTNYPPFHNASCGMHIHMSFSNALVYQRLMKEEYQETLLEYVRKWATDKLPADHHIFSRLDGSSEYCQKKFWPDLQVKADEKKYDRSVTGHRYTAVHYCWGRYQTIELRFPPIMPTVELAIELIEHCLDLTNAFLVATVKKEPIFKSEWHLDETKHVEEFIECV